MSIISNEERVKLFEILYPVASFDANFYPDLTEEALDEFKIPKNTRNLYIIGTDEVLNKKIYNTIKRHHKKLENQGKNIG